VTFVDIGGNIGWFSLNMAALGVKVMAFEPMQKNTEMI
jgi:FkbM family methyltransferase